MTRTKKETTKGPIVYYEDLTPWQKFKRKENLRGLFAFMFPFVGSAGVVVIMTVLATNLSYELVNPDLGFLAFIGIILVGLTFAIWVVLISVIMVLTQMHTDKELNLIRRHPLR